MPSLAEIIEPAVGRIAVLVDTRDEITPAGLYIPTEQVKTIHESRATQGTIISMGDASLSDPDNDEYNYGVGDRVVFGKYNGTEISYQPPGEPGKPRPPKERIIILTHKDILCKFNIPEEADNVKVRL